MFSSIQNWYNPVRIRILATLLVNCKLQIYNPSPYYQPSPLVTVYVTRIEIATGLKHACPEMEFLNIS
jgi:hypothetical protein